MNPATPLIVLAATGLPFAFLGWKWELGSRAVLPRLVLFVLLNSLLAWLFGIEEPLHIVLLCWVMLLLEVPSSILPFFYRDPERTSQADPKVVLSPADGHVVYVKKITGGSMPLCNKKGRSFTPVELSGIDGLPTEGYLVGIGMTFLDVHVTRTPITGRISMLKRVPGIFMSLKRPEAVARNERLSMLIEGEDITLAVILIASRLIRRIVPFVSEGDGVQRGDRTGIIKLGSQVDIILPLERVEVVTVRTGDTVKAGVTPIARLQ